ncbi:MAG: four helix bundle protein [Brevefilum sp.]
MAQKNQGLESLEIWRRAVDYAVDMCQNVIPLFPPEEKWALASQLRRSVQSIPANIAEGYGRYNFQETIHYCYIARGSMAETKTHLVLAFRMGYIKEEIYLQFLDQLNDLGKMTNGYVAHLRKQKSINGLKETHDSDESYQI